MEKLLNKKTAGKNTGKKSKSEIEQAELRELINDMVDNHPMEKYKFVKMALCKNIYKGEQYKTIDESDLSIISVEDTGETRCKYNIVKPLLNSWASKMLDGDPVPVAKPHEGNTESVDIDVAKICTSILHSRWATARMRKKLGGAVRWGGKTGLGIFKQLYNKDGGYEIEVDKEAAEDLGLTEEEYAGMYSGSCELELVDPEDFFPDPVMQPEWLDHRMVVHRFKMPLTQAEDTFDLPRGTLQADDKIEKEKYRQETTESADSVNLTSDTKESDIVFVKELWMKADSKYEEGKHVILINDKLVVDDPNPNPDRLPFFLFPINREEDEFVGQGYVWPLHPIQRDYSKAWSLIYDNLEWTMINKVLEPTSANLMPNAFNQLAGERVKFAGQIPPQYLQGASLPGHLYDIPDRVFSVGQIILAQPDVDLGNLPNRGSQMSGKSIQELKESSAMAHAEDKNAIKECLKDLCIDYLQTVQAKYSVEQILDIVGKNRREDVEKFKEADISDESVDIDITLAQGFGTSPSVKMQQIMDLVDRKIFSPMEARKGLGNFGNIDMIIDESELDKGKAERNLRKVLSGVPHNSGIMSKYDNYAVHMQVFKNFTKKPEWDDLDDEQKTSIDMYVAQAQDLMMQQMQAMAMANQPPMPPGGGAPGQQQPKPNTASQQMEAEDNLHLSPGPPQMQQGFGQGQGV